MRVVPGRGMDLPALAADVQGLAGLHGLVGAVGGAALAGGAVAQGRFVPGLHGGPGPHGHADAAAVRLLQRGVAAAVVRMQVGVDDARQAFALQRMGHQGGRLRGVVDVAAVDQHGAFAPAVQQDVVRRQPAALEHAQAGGLTQRILHRADRVRPGRSMGHDSGGSARGGGWPWRYHRWHQPKASSGAGPTGRADTPAPNPPPNLPQEEPAA